MGYCFIVSFPVFLCFYMFFPLMGACCAQMFLSKPCLLQANNNLCHLQLISS